MNYKKMFSKFVWRLRLEALTKALLIGLCIGLGIGTAVTVISRMAIWECDILTMLLYSLCAGLVLTLPCFLFCYPDLKRAVRRVDQTGLDERMSTMLALQNEDSFIALKQRKDAMERLEKVKPSHMPFKVSYKLLASVGAMLIALCLTSLVPYRSLKAEAAPLPPEIVEQSRIISDLIIELRIYVDSADVSDGFKTELHKIVNEVEESVDDFDTTLEKVAKISEARTKILNLINKEVNGVNIADELIKDEGLADLGEAIKNQDANALHKVLEALRNEMLSLSGEERKAWLLDMAEKLNSAVNAVSTPDQEQQDEIVQAIKDLAATLEEAAGAYENEADENPDDSSAGIAGVGISGTEQEIIDETEIRNELSEELNQILGIIDDARNELLGVTEEDEAEEGEEPDDSLTEDETEDEDGEEGGTDSPGVTVPDNSEDKDEEEIFTPGLDGSFGDDDYELTDEDFIRDVYDQIIESGNVSYKDSYLDYYASALESIARSEIPDELKDVIINYFTSLE